ncbi:Uncharacterized protein dnm_047130 [Desulfonema magnum]|uniref:Uncharacterized protein n=1 Tax=Desulfonema magnum TaxID=45655 RepID=A0A975BNA6_9BACT|nr:Uncharacterized protein dnm_047130 [Desulfonema magnum]
MPDQCVGCGICEPKTGRFEVSNNELHICPTDRLHKKELPKS